MPKGFLSSTGRMSMISLDGMEISCPDRLQGSETEGSRFVCKTMVCTLKVVSSHLMRLRYCKSLYLLPALILVVYKNQHRRPEPCFQVDQSSNIQEPGAGSLLRSCDGCPWPLLRWPTQLNPVRSKRSAVIQTFHSKFILQNDTDPVRKKWLWTVLKLLCARLNSAYRGNAESAGSSSKKMGNGTLSSSIFSQESAYSP